jgi:hypothetical protein
MKIPLNSLTVAREFTILRPQLVEKSRLILTHLPVSNHLVWYSNSETSSSCQDGLRQAGVCVFKRPSLSYVTPSGWAAPYDTTR